MIIEKIKIKNFRNISNAELDPGPKINFILGNNAHGKTNYAEAIYTTSLLKSFRTSNIDETIKENEKYTAIKILVNNNKVNSIIEFNYGKKNKSLKINSKKPNDNKFYSYLNVIIFHPEEVNYISNYPLFRRNLLDRSIFYSNYKYIDDYKNYVRCLKQRNTFLKSTCVKNDYWKDQLIKYGAEIIRQRLFYIKKINSFFSQESFQKINNEKYNITYSRSYTELNSIEDQLSEDFKYSKNREISLGHTLVGPHRDDINFFINGKSAEKYSSQGQKRSLIISFKTAQINDYKNIHGYFPILILDDMDSELDSNRKNILIENILTNSGQVFITSTDINKKNIGSYNKIFNVADGVISLTE